MLHKEENILQAVVGRPTLRAKPTLQLQRLGVAPPTEVDGAS